MSQHLAIPTRSGNMSHGPHSHHKPPQWTIIEAIDMVQIKSINEEEKSSDAYYISGISKPITA